VTERPLVSLVTPSFNQGAYLEATLDSVAAQDYPWIEHIVVDGGSTDGSVEIIRRHEDRLASWVSERDDGQADALDRGFARATGDILGWLNADDTLLPGAVSAAVAALEADPDALFAYGDNVLIDEEGRDLGPLPARPFDVAEMVRTCQNHVPQPGSLFRRRALELVGRFHGRGYYYFDFDFVLLMALAGRAIRLEQPLATYRLHDESKSMGAPLRKAENHLQLFDGLLGRGDLPPEVRAVAREARARSNLVAGEYFYDALALGRARRALLRAVATDPRVFDRRTAPLLAKALLPRPAVARLRRVRRG
jgi:glycosyltransferase involved in cell wall biosynthesis